MVDNEWRQLEKVNYEIKVKGEERPVPFTVKYTHRGPVITADTISKNLVHFENSLPLLENDEQFSLSWGGHHPGESLMQMQYILLSAKSLPEIKSKMP